VRLLVSNSELPVAIRSSVENELWGPTASAIPAAAIAINSDLVQEDVNRAVALLVSADALPVQ